MQNEPNFKKVKLSITIEMKKDYVQMDTWSIRKNEPKTNPNEPKTNPILANKTPIRTQFKPNTNPIQTQTNPILCHLYCTFLKPFFAVKWAVNENILLRKENYERK
jgi:hypothetical protein